MNEIIRGIYESGIAIARDGHVRDLASSIDQHEGKFLFDIIQNDAGILKTLEVGCALGLSSLHICAALHNRSGAKHIIIDPVQTTDWHSLGLEHLQNAGFDFFELIESQSELALPRILEKKEGAFDLIFVDGWHTFDHTLLDCFYSTRLLRVGGYLVVDDVTMPAISGVVDFLKTYPCYEQYGWVGQEGVKPSWRGKIAKRFGLPNSERPPIVRMVALRKISEDARGWDWHPNRKM